ncbi:MAG: DUF3160 domain-containing protein [Deltaproteobacteria bacterium]|nr:DUF3160 domain-containing protein [Deltaproteobacteria bacterium]
MRRILTLPGLLTVALMGCSSADGPPAGDPGADVEVPLSPAQQAELTRIEGELTATQNLTPEGLLTRYATAQVSAVDYDPKSAARLGLIQDSVLALNTAEEGALAANGFVISEAKRFPSFLYGYETIYNQDLPVYVSADSVLHAVHSSYDEILKTLELVSLAPELDAMLTAMRGKLAFGAAASLGAQAEADADLYLAVAQSLLRDTREAPVRGASQSDIDQFVGAADQAEGWLNVSMFGVPRDMDFSQFEPRGHYTESKELTQYFKAMMWLGRIDLRIVEAQPDHSQVFRRRQLEGAFALRSLMDDATVTRWAKIDGTIEAFVGEPDNMTLPQLDALLKDLGLTSPDQLGTLDDDKIAQAVLQGGYGAQRISSHIMINGLGERTMPLSSTFLLLGQRYVVDSHVFSNLVYDRVQRGEVMRMMPNPVDVAFAALGNDQAATLLQAELQQYRYAPDLHAMRYLVDEHGQEFWGANLYNRWLTALRALSPTDELANPEQAGLPQLMATEAWGRRLINTQLASWAELRHDTILYAKQSYTGGTSCEFPDAYVEPYPAFFAAIVELAQHGRQVVQNLDLSRNPAIQQYIVAYFDELETTAGILGAMAEQQRIGAAFTDEQMAFINQAVVVQQGCGSPAGAEGWFARMYYNPAAGAEWDPTIADVHTQPTDEVGTPVGKVLHVGTGGPRVMVVTLPTCTGVNAYVGLVSSYFEQVTEGFDRLTDERWGAQIQTTRPADVSWMQDLVVR